MRETAAVPDQANNAAGLHAALASAALATLPHALWLSPWYPAATLLGLGLRALQLRLGRQAISVWLLAGLAVLAVLTVVLQYGSPIGRDAGVSLLLAMTGLKALECRRDRDAYVLVELALFLLAASFFFQQSLPYAGYALVVVILALQAMTTLSGTALPPWPARLRLAGRLLGTALPLMAVLFVFFPRFDSPLGALRDPSRTGVTGLSDQMTPGSIAELIRSDEVAFRVRFEGRPPPPAQRYWRGPVLWDYDGRSWRQGEGDHAGPEALAAGGEPLRYSVILPGNGRRWILALDQPAAAPPGTHLGAARQLLSDQPLTEARRFELASYTDYVLAPEPHRYRLTRALALPADAAPRARELATGWRRELRDPQAVVRRALEMFRGQPFRYTLRPPPLQGDPVDAFLFETRAGFCEYYAGAFVVLMRAAGIPARVVTGYLGGEPSPVADYTLVRQSDAHAWAEVWLQGRGWHRVDPTAAVSPERVETGLSGALAGSEELPGFLRSGYRNGLANRLQLLWDALDYRWTAWVLGFSGERQRELVDRLGLDRFGGQGLIIALVASLGLIALVQLGLYRWRGWRSRGPELERAYRELLALLRRRGLERRPQEGPSDFIRRAAAALPEVAGELRRLNRIYVAARYGGVRTRATAPALHEGVRRLRRRLRGQASSS